MIPLDNTKLLGVRFYTYGHILHFISASNPLPGNNAAPAQYGATTVNRPFLKKYLGDLHQNRLELPVWSIVFRVSDMPGFDQKLGSNRPAVLR